ELVLSFSYCSKVARLGCTPVEVKNNDPVLFCREKSIDKYCFVQRRYDWVAEVECAVIVALRELGYEGIGRKGIPFFSDDNLYHDILRSEVVLSTVSGAAGQILFKHSSRAARYGAYLRTRH